MSEQNPLDGALSKYTDKSSSSYDPAFDKEIREAAPQWFEDRTTANKAKLLEMARNDEPRPNRGGSK